MSDGNSSIEQKYLNTGIDGSGTIGGLEARTTEKETLGATRIAYSEGKLPLDKLLGLFWQNNLDPAILNYRLNVPFYYSSQRVNEGERVGLYASLGSNNAFPELKDEEYLQQLKNSRGGLHGRGGLPRKVRESLVPLGDYGPDLAAPRKVAIDQNVAIFFALMAVCQRLEDPQTKAPISSLSDVLAYLRSKDEVLDLNTEAFERGIFDLTQTDNVNMLIQQKIVTEEELDNFFGQVIDWKRQLHLMPKPKNRGIPPEAPLFPVKDKGEGKYFPYHFKFLPHLAAATLLHFPDIADWGGTFNLQMIVSAKEDIFDLSIKNVREACNRGLNKESRQDDETVDKTDVRGLIRELQAINPVLAGEISSVFESLSKIRPLFDELINYYRRDPKGLNVKDPQFSAAGKPPTLKAIREQIAFYGGRSDNSSLYFRVRKAVKGN